MLKWAAFFLLALIWGSSFLLISVAVEQLTPFQIVFIRTGIAAVGLNIALAFQHKHLPFTGIGIRGLLILGVISTTIPFALITWGEKSVDSGLASVLNATAALFTLIIAHYTLKDERITTRKFIGLIVGFFGVVVLTSRSFENGQLITGNLVGQLAIIVASFFYGLSAPFSRGLMKNYTPLTVSAGAMTFGAITTGILMVVSPLLGGQPNVPLTDLRNDVLVAVVALGLVNTFVAYLIFYWLINELGSARASMVTYVIPAVGLALGVIVRDEELDIRLILGALLIFASIIIVNVRLSKMRRQRLQPAIAGENI